MLKDIINECFKISDLQENTINVLNYYGVDNLYDFFALKSSDKVEIYKDLPNSCRWELKGVAYEIERTLNKYIGNE